MPFHEVSSDGLPNKPGIYEIKTAHGQHGYCYFNGDKFAKAFNPWGKDGGLRIELDFRNPITHWKCP